MVLTVGTFLDGKIHVGEVNYSGGRAGDPASLGLAKGLRGLGLNVGRLKTGTPPRIDGRSIDYAQLGEQPGDVPVPVFSFLGRRAEHPRQVSCHITHTTERTHEIIRAALDRSPLYTGAIEGVGPRYCPSIEDKVVRFADRTRHQIFVEPEGLDTFEVYPNGISTSLPFDVQLDLVRSIPGLEHAHLTRPGYAIEYDFFDPRDLKATLETKAVAGPLLRGPDQRHDRLRRGRGARHRRRHQRGPARPREREPWYPRRDEAYIGVLIDDLDHARHDRAVSHVHEPRGVPARSARGQRRSAAHADRAEARARRRRALAELRGEARMARGRGCAPAGHRRAPLRRAGGRRARAARARHARRYGLLRRPDVAYRDVAALARVGESPALGGVDAEGAELWIGSLETEARYAGYVARQSAEIDRQSRQDGTPLPSDLDYAAVHGLSNEIREKLVPHSAARHRSGRADFRDDAGRDLAIVGPSEENRTPHGLSSGPEARGLQRYSQRSIFGMKRIGAWAAMIAGVALAGCGGGGAAPGGTPIGGATGTELAEVQALHFGNGAEIQTLDPHRGEEVPGSNVAARSLRGVDQRGAERRFVPGRGRIVDREPRRQDLRVRAAPQRALVERRPR